MPGKHGESKDEWARDLLDRDPQSLEQALTWNAEDRLSAGSQALVWNEFQELHAALVRRGKSTHGWERLYPRDLRVLQAKINERVFGPGGARQGADSGPMGAATRLSASSLPARDDGRDVGTSAVSNRAVLRMVDTVDEGDEGVSEESVIGGVLLRGWRRLTAVERAETPEPREKGVSKAILASPPKSKAGFLDGVSPELLGETAACGKVLACAAEVLVTGQKLHRTIKAPSGCLTGQQRSPSAWRSSAAPLRHGRAPGLSWESWLRVLPLTAGRSTCG